MFAVVSFIRTIPRMYTRNDLFWSFVFIATIRNLDVCSCTANIAFGRTFAFLSDFYEPC